MDSIKWVFNSMPAPTESKLPLMSGEQVEKARDFHSSFEEYQPTPLAKLDKAAEYLGINSVCVKDESYRFGLNAFKVLGGSYAIGRYIAQRLGKDISELPYSVLASKEVADKLGDVTFFTATDGNHGRGVAWAANRLGQKSVVYMPKGSSQIRLQHILDEGSDASITEFNYDDAVRLAAAKAAEVPNGVVVQDTAWEGYEEIPTWIMQGYGTMALEAAEQLKNANFAPTHIFVQAGVGSLAGAVEGFFANYYAGNKPKMVVIEADSSACLYRGALAGDGNIRTVGGDLPTIMAGLACGEPNTISWEILKECTDCFIAAPNWVAAKGMRMLAAPLKGDEQVISGESGAVNMGALAAIMLMEEYRELREKLELDENSRVLTFSTEGDTDPDMFKRVVWDGAYPSYEE